MGTWPDMEQTLTDILNAAWTQANVDSARTTYINEKDEEKRVALSNQDVVLPYFVSSTAEEIGLIRQHLERHDRGAIDVITIESRTVLQKLCKEVERIMYASYKSPTTKPSGAQYHVLRPLQWTRVADYVNFWKYTLEVEGIAHWESR